MRGAVFDYNSLFHAYAMYDIIIKGSVNSKLEQQPTVSLKGPGEILSTNIIMLLFKTECFLFTYTCALRLAQRYVMNHIYTYIGAVPISRLDQISDQISRL